MSEREWARENERGRERLATGRMPAVQKVCQHVHDLPVHKDQKKYINIYIYIYIYLWRERAEYI